MTAKVLPENQGLRLDLYLISQFPTTSRSQFKQLLNEGKVLVNSKVEYKPHYHVKADDEIEVTEQALARKEIPGSDMPIDVVYEDENCAAINKPSPLKVHPTFYLEQDTLLNGLYSHFKNKLTDYGVVLVNRIDADTSGLVLVCFNPSAAWYYSKQFASNSVTKHYLAVVDRSWVSEYDQEDVEVSNKLRYIQRRASQSEEGEFAATKFKFWKYNQKGQAVLIVSPQTGRTHQIRVHLADLGFPIIGDSKYNGAESSRLMLHAWKLTLTKFPNGEEITFEAPIPEPFL